MRAKFRKVPIMFKVENCKECPFCRGVRVTGTGLASDYFCAHGKGSYAPDAVIRNYPLIMSDVEWGADESPVPVWCPIRVD